MTPEQLRKRRRERVNRWEAERLEARAEKKSRRMRRAINIKLYGTPNPAPGMPLKPRGNP